jgi:ATP-binding protein involved in chromosome partitioning
MSYFECKCGEKSYPFSQGGSVKLAKEHDMEVLGELPLSNAIREHADDGKALILSQPDSNISAIYQAIARKVSISLATKLALHQLAREDATATNNAVNKNGVNIQIVNKS